MIDYQLGENKNVEYKQEYNKTLLKTVSAFANYNDGLITIGINDKGEVRYIFRIYGTSVTHQRCKRFASSVHQSVTTVCL